MSVPYAVKTLQTETMHSGLIQSTLGKRFNVTRRYFALVTPKYVDMYQCICYVEYENMTIHDENET